MFEPLNLIDVPRIYRVFRMKLNRNGRQLSTGVRCMELHNRVFC